MNLCVFQMGPKLKDWQHPPPPINTGTWSSHRLRL
jgi:hypothetical protein